MSKDNEIKNPRRMLVVGRPGSGMPDLLKALTGTAPTPLSETASLSGTSSSLSITTPYYTATIPIWLDEPSCISTWKSDFLSPEAKEVVSVLGAIIVIFRKSDGEESVKELLDAVREVVGEGWEGGVWGVGMGAEKDGMGMRKDEGVKEDGAKGMLRDEDWDEMCLEREVEWVDGEGTGKNELGEKVGVERLREALEANDWSSPSGDDPELDDLDFDEDDVGSFDMEAAQLEMEMFGLKQSILNQEEEEEEEGVDDAEAGKPEDDDEVEKLSAMMLRMQAVKDMGADLPETERRKFAAKAVKDLMKDF